VAAKQISLMKDMVFVLMLEVQVFSTCKTTRTTTKHNNNNNTDEIFEEEEEDCQMLLRDS
jgi:hypothetical protein